MIYANIIVLACQADRLNLTFIYYGVKFLLNKQKTTFYIENWSLQNMPQPLDVL